MDITQQGQTPMPTVLPSTGGGLFGGQPAVPTSFLTQLAQLLQAAPKQQQGNAQQPQMQGGVGGLPATSGYDPNGIAGGALKNLGNYLGSQAFGANSADPNFMGPPQANAWNPSASFGSNMVNSAMPSVLSFLGL